MKAWAWLQAHWADNGTKWLGTTQAIIAGLISVDGLIPQHSLKYWAAVNVVLGGATLRRGFVNSARQ